MQGDYALYVRKEAYQGMRTGSRVTRDRIIAFMESLQTDPFQSGDYSETDSTGRDCQVKIVGKYAVYFWADHAVKEVRIADIVDADRE